MKIDHKLLKRKTDVYDRELSAYIEYKKFLHEVLESMCREFAPYAFIEARAKSPASFAEKIVRKQAKFHADPNYDVTDRCGARVIVQSAEDVRVVSAFIEKNFIVDAANSLDHGAHLRTMEFGYRSVHYVVQLRKDDRKLAEVAIPSAVKQGKKGFKAEIQVRTLAEHVLSSGLHDRLYKVPIKVPEPLKRENARLAAILESVDVRYSSLANGIDAYLGHYSAYLTKEKMAEEITILRAARKHEKDQSGKMKLTLRLAILARLSGNLNEAVSELEDTINSGAPAGFRAELGYALCLKSEKNPLHTVFLRGQEMLGAVVDEKPTERRPETAGVKILRGEAAHRLAWSLSLQPGKEPDARKRFREARELDPANPYHLAAYLEYEIFFTRSAGFVPVMADVLREAIGTCERHIAVGIEIPRAHFTIGRLYLLLADLPASMAAFVAGLAIMLTPGAGIPSALLRDELKFLNRINDVDHLPPAHELVRRLLLIGQAVAKGSADTELNLSASGPDIVERIRQSATRGVLIVAGGAAGMPGTNLQKYRAIVERALHKSDGLVISGGTDCGIPGLVGKVATKFWPKGRRQFHLLGYAPTREHLDPGHYDEIVQTDGKDFSLLEPLQSWVDLLRAGVDPARVQLLCINGGRIAAFEMRLALALGARIGVVSSSGRAADALLADPWWCQHRKNVVPLPADGLDSATMRAFVRPATFTLPEEDLEAMAEQVHANYVTKNLYEGTDYSPQRRKYRDLRPDLKASNRQQILYAAEILSTQGYAIVKHDGNKKKIVLPKFKLKTQIELMAALEHGRWNIERLAEGWIYGKPPKNFEKKTTPWLIAYEQLPDGPDGMKRYDRDAITDYAGIYKTAGYAIVKREANLRRKKNTRPSRHRK